MKLLLVGGTGRSGTSFVYRQFNQGENFHGISEFETSFFTGTSSFVDLWDIYTRSYTADRFLGKLSQFKMRIVAHFADNGVDVDLEPLFARFGKTLLTERGFQVPAETLFTIELRRFLWAAFVGDKELDSSHDNFLVEKTPHNAFVYQSIQEMYPDSYLIHVIRDPRAIAESVARQKWGPNNYRDAVFWTRRLLEGWIEKQQSRNAITQNYLVIRAEDLVENHLALKMEISRMLRSDLSKISLQGSSSALDGWAEEISQDDLEFANDKLRNIMSYFNYDPREHSAIEQSKSTYDINLSKTR